MKKGGFTFVLHSHLPYCRLAGRWPHGEEWIHEAAAETYVPLLNALYDLRAENVPFKLTIGITPILTEQLIDPLIIDHFEEYLEERIVAAEKDIERFSSEGMTRARDEARAAAARAKLEAEERAKEEARARLVALIPAQPVLLKGRDALRIAADIKKAAAEVLAMSRTGKAIKPEPELEMHEIQSQATDVAIATQDIETAETELETGKVEEAPVPAEPRHGLAIYYRDWYANIRDTFQQRFNRDIVGAFRKLQDEGGLEIITCAATHGYLPLLSRDSSINGQLKTGIASYVKNFGRRPKAIWLPECAYRPAYYAQDEDGTAYVRPGIEDFLADNGLHLFFSETHTVEGGVPVGKAAGETLIGPYSYVKRRYVLPHAEEFPKTGGTTFQPYWVVRQDVAVMGRNNRTGMQVWSSKFGYPGDGDYREFHSKDSGSGLQYWRITGSDVDLGAKEFYNPEWAKNRAPSHADHFVYLVEQELSEYHQNTGKKGLIDCNYDTELFGHWWFEGVEWLKEVLRRLAFSETVELVTASQWLEENPPETTMAIPESSWGQQGTHYVWLNDENEWMWEPIHAAERRIEDLVVTFGDSSDPDVQFVLAQITRELVLLQSSDWPFLVTTGQAIDYSIKRFNEHVERFNTLADGLVAGRGTVSAELMEEARRLHALDNPFPDINPHDFVARQGVPAGVVS